MDKMAVNTISDLLQEGTAFLGGREIPAPRREAELLLCALLSVRRLDLYIDPARPAPPAVEELFHDWLRRRAGHEPLQYITGEVDFFGMALSVERGVFIPRPETELIVEAALALFPSPRRILDLCTGSGALAVALAKHLPSAEVVATDLSKKALATARRNAERHDCPIFFLRGDLLAPFQAGAPFDLIVCNPPYIPEGDRPGLQPEVRDHEPAAALFAGEEGVAFYRRILRDAALFLSPGGHLLLELGDGQAGRLEAFVNDASDLNVAFIRDLSGTERVAVCRRAAVPATPGGRGGRRSDG